MPPKAASTDEFMLLFLRLIIEKMGGAKGWSEKKEWQEIANSIAEATGKNMTGHACRLRYLSLMQKQAIATTTSPGTAGEGSQDTPTKKTTTKKTTPAKRRQADTTDAEISKKTRKTEVDEDEEVNGELEDSDQN